MRSHPFVRAFLKFLRCGWYLVMYTRFFLFCSLVCQPRDFFCRVVGPRWSIGLFLGFCILFQSVWFWSWRGLTLGCQGRSWWGFLRWLHVPFMNPRKTESGWHDVRWRYWYVSVGLVWVLISSILEFVNLFPLYTVVSEKVISYFDSKWVNLRRWWKLLAVWKKFVMSYLVAFSHIMKPSFLNRTCFCVASFWSSVPVFGGDVCRRFLVTVLLLWMPQWFGGLICRWTRSNYSWAVFPLVGLRGVFGLYYSVLGRIPLWQHVVNCLF